MREHTDSTDVSKLEIMDFRITISFVKSIATPLGLKAVFQDSSSNISNILKLTTKIAPNVQAFADGGVFVAVSAHPQMPD